MTKAENMSLKEFRGMVADQRAQRRAKTAAARAAAPAEKAPFDGERIMQMYESSYAPTGYQPTDREAYLEDLEDRYYVMYPDARSMEDLAEALTRAEVYQ
jgi:hypothetical protein